MRFSKHVVRAASIVVWSCAWWSVAQAQTLDLSAASSAFTSLEPPNDNQTGSDPERAKALFYEALSLHDQGDIAVACEKLRESLALNPTVGTLLNLGRCQRELGKVVTAHDYYRRAEVLATLKGDLKRQAAAHEEAAELAPRRATLWLQIPEKDRGPLEVRIDDVPQPVETWSHPMFIDAGEHSVSIRTSEREPFLDRVRVQDGVRAVLVVPDLQRLPASPLRAAVPASKPSSLVSPELLAYRDASQSRGEGLGTARVAALVVGGAGVVSLTAGLLFGQLAKSANDRSHKTCPAPEQVCEPQAVSLRNDAFAHATRSTVLSIAGAVAIVSGVTLWLVSPRSEMPPQPTLALSVSPAALGPQVYGRF